MAKNYDIDIDSFIGSFTCNKRGIKKQLADLGDKEITVRVNSLGGDVDTALDIAAQFEDHGRITCDLYAFNASAATIFPMVAKKVRIHENGMFLIHKAMVWVDEFGRMNEDDLDTLIEKLKGMQQDSAVVTLNIAKIYVKKTGKPIQDILNLMKQERWLDAATAKEWGFVDEIFNGSVPAKKQTGIVEMMNLADLPVPENVGVDYDEDDQHSEKLMTGILNFFRNFYPTNKPEIEMNKSVINAALLLAILNVQEFELTDGKVILTSEQIEEIENALLGKKNEIEQLTNQLTEKSTKISNLETEIQNLNKAPGDDTRDVNNNGDKVLDEDTKAFDDSPVAAAKALFDALP